MNVRIRPVTADDEARWLALREALWPPDGDSSHKDEIEEFLAGKLQTPLAVLLAEAEDGHVIGFVELNIRPYAAGCNSHNVGYLEGWYVIPEARRLGVGRALVNAAEEWAKAQGCLEFASDALVDNEVSAAAHHALGFEEVEIVRCFKKTL